MKNSVARALFKSHSYQEYRKIISDLLDEGKSTGMEQSEDLTHYSILNETRMNRLDKTIKVSEDSIANLQNLKRDYIWLVITEGWCGDAAQILPVFNKMAELSDKVELRIVFRDENEELMNLFLTNKTKSIPKLIIIDKETGSVQNHWGPRPKGAVNLIQNYKEQHGSIDETAKAELQMWYLHDKGISTQNEVIKMMIILDELKLQMH